MATSLQTPSVDPVTADPVTAAQECCVPLAAGFVDDETAVDLGRMFKALGEPTRVKLLSLIASASGGEACICDLTEPVGLAQPTVSHHMKTLVDAGLVTREQRGKWAYFAIVPKRLATLRQALALSE